MVCYLLEGNDVSGMFITTIRQPCIHSGITYVNQCDITSMLIDRTNVFNLSRMVSLCVTKQPL